MPSRFLAAMGKIEEGKDLDQQEDRDDASPENHAPGIAFSATCPWPAHVSTEFGRFVQVPLDHKFRPDRRQEPQVLLAVVLERPMTGV